MSAAVQSALLSRNRVQPLEWVYWILPIAAYFVFSDSLAFATSVLVMTIMALSFSLVLSFAGIVSLGHAAFFGIGAYVAGLLSLDGWREPISAALIAGGGAALFVSPACR
jgi:branched-chain amino acid transport system permease protein